MLLFQAMEASLAEDNPRPASCFNGQTAGLMLGVWEGGWADSEELV